MTGAYVWAALCYLPALYLITVCLYTIAVAVADATGRRRADRELRALIRADRLARKARRP